MPRCVSKTADYTLTVSDFAVGFDTSAAARTATLPASSVENQIAWIFDRSNNAGTNNITIARNGKTIQGASADKTISQNGGFMILQYRASANDWDIIAQSFAADGGNPFLELSGAVEASTGAMPPADCWRSSSRPARAIITSGRRVSWRATKLKISACKKIG